MIFSCLNRFLSTKYFLFASNFEQRGRKRYWNYDFYESNSIANFRTCKLFWINKRNRCPKMHNLNPSRGVHPPKSEKGAERCGHALHNTTFLKLTRWWSSIVLALTTAAGPSQTLMDRRPYLDMKHSEMKIWAGLLFWLWFGAELTISYSEFQKLAGTLISQKIGAKFSWFAFGI